MINLMQSIRYFVLVLLCLPIAIVTTANGAFLPRIPAVNQKPTSSLVSADQLKQAQSAAALAIATFCKNMGINRIGDSVKNISVMYPCLSKDFMVENVSSHPKVVCSIIALCALASSLYACKKIMLPETWQAFKDYFASKAEALGNACYDCLPSELQGIILLFKRPMVALKNMVMNYTENNKKYAALTATCALGGNVVGWPVTGYTLAGISFAYGAFMSGFDRLEAKMDKYHQENQKSFVEIKNQIEHLGSNVDSKVDNVGVQVQEVDAKAQKIFLQISDLENNLKKQLKELGDENKESVQSLRDTVAKEISELKKSFTEKLESNITSLSKALKDDLEKESKKLAHQIEVNESCRLDDTKCLHEQVESLGNKLELLNHLVIVYNHNNTLENKELKNLVESVIEHNKQYNKTVIEEFKKLDDTFIDVKNELTQKIEQQNSVMQDIVLGLNNVSKEVRKDIESIQKEIGAFKEEAKKNAAQATENIVQKIDAVNKHNKKLVDNLKDELLIQVEEFVLEVQKESLQLSENVNKTQNTVDRLQKVQNDCVYILNALLESNKATDSKVESLMTSVKKNQELLYEKFELIEITSQVEVAAINDRLDKIDRAIISNNQELLAQMKNVVEDVANTKELLKKVDEKSEELLKKVDEKSEELLKKVDEKSDDTYTQMSKVLEKTTDLSAQVQQISDAFIVLKTQDDQNGNCLEQLSDQVKDIKKDFTELTTSIEKTYSIIEGLEKKQNRQAEILSQVVRKQDQQGMSLEEIVKKQQEEASSRTAAFEDLERKYKILENLLLQQQKDSQQNQAEIKSILQNLALRGDQRFDQTQQGQQKIFDILSNLNNPQNPRLEQVVPVVIDNRKKLPSTSHKKKESGKTFEPWALIENNRS